MTKSEKKLKDYKKFKSINFGNRTQTMQQKLENALKQIG